MSENNQYIPALVSLSNYGTSLSSTDFMVMNFLVNRTLKYGKFSEYIPYRHWLTGVFTKTGQLLHHPVSITKTTLISSFERLQKLGLLSYCTRMFCGSPTNYFTIKLDALMTRMDQVALKLSKKHKQKQEQNVCMRNEEVVQNDTNGGYKIAPVGGIEKHQSISNRSIRRSDVISSRNREDSLESSQGTPREVLDKTINQARIRYKNKLKNQAAKLTDTPTMTGTSAAWKLSFMNHYEGRTVVTDFSDNAFAKFRKGYESHYLPEGFTLAEFIDWTIENWSTFPACSFTWILPQHYPALPSFPYFAKMFKYYVRAYGELKERGVMFNNIIQLKSERGKDQRKLQKSNNENNALRRKYEELEQKNQHLTRVIKESRKKPTREKIDMVPVDELDFESIEKLPAW